ncbi:MAG TPA: class I SAM-dependent methyltransferase [Vicinamibacterales bacterium]|nr:class I SAM-dependent methyltransferase [Vicinamibacterales bacterium]
MSETGRPEYGASDHYLGDKGKEYFSWQDGGALFAGKINAHKFRDLIKPSDTVLDFGCGGGGLLANLSCARKVGVEINPAAREVARSRGIECYAAISDVPDAMADVIVSDHALEHVPFPIAALRELRGKLKSDGVLSICVPIDNWRHQNKYNPDDQNHHLHTWTAQLLGNTLFEAGFQVVSIHSRIFAWPGGWTVAAYGRLPYALFRAICYSYGAATGKGWETLSVAKRNSGAG